MDETPETEVLQLCEVVGPGRGGGAVLGPPFSTCAFSSPGEDTDNTVTETTPSSANITPSQSGELHTQVDYDVAR